MRVILQLEAVKTLSKIEQTVNGPIKDFEIDIFLHMCIMYTPRKKSRWTSISVYKKVDVPVFQSISESMCQYLGL